MRHRLIASILLLSAPATAEGVTLLEAGIFCAAPLTGAVRPAPDTVEGVVQEMRADRFDILGQVVPTIPGLAFGIRLRSDMPEDRLVRMVTLHPPMGEDARRRSSWETVLAPGAVRSRAFSFDHAYELVPGRWTMEVRDGDDTLLAVPFTITDAPVPTVEAACGRMSS